MKWKFIDLRTGWDIQVAPTERERDRFIRYCNRERVRCGVLRVDETGIEVEHAVLGE